MPLAAILVAAAALVVGVWGQLIARRAEKHTARTVEENRLMRLDTLAPRLFIDDPEPMRERWNVGDGGDVARFPPGVAEPGPGPETPGSDGWRYLVGAVLTITNQGQQSARLSMTGAYRLDDPAVLDTSETERLLQAGSTLPETRLPTERLTINPGQQLRILVRAGPTLRHWIDADGDQPYRVEIRAESTPDAPIQAWMLTLEARLLSRVSNNASSYSVLPHVPVLASLAELPRIYPGSAG